MDVTIAAETQPWALPGLCRLTYSSQVDGLVDWAMLLPPGGGDVAADDDDASRALWVRGGPSAAMGKTWIINLHGHGSTGDQLYTRQDIRQRWLPRFMREGYGVLSPNLRGNAWMCPEAVADLHALIAWLRRHQQAERFILASGSMGGTGSLIYATQHPQDVAGVVALCPATDLPSYHQWCAENSGRPIIAEIHQAITRNYGGDVSRMARHSTLANHEKLDMPVYVIHGDADTAIPVRQAMALDMMMKKRPEVRFEYLQLPGGNHDAPLWLMDKALDWIKTQLR